MIFLPAYAQNPVIFAGFCESFSLGSLISAYISHKLKDKLKVLQ